MNPTLRALLTAFCEARGAVGPLPWPGEDEACGLTVGDWVFALRADRDGDVLRVDGYAVDAPENEADRLAFQREIERLNGEDAPWPWCYWYEPESGGVMFSAAVGLGDRPDPERFAGWIEAWADRLDALRRDMAERFTLPSYSPEDAGA